MKNKTFGYITVLLLLSLTSLFSLKLYFRQRTTQDQLDIRKFPHVVGEWQGEEIELNEYDYRVLETRNLILREYVNSSNEKLTLFIVYSETNRSVFHPPEVCLMGSGMNIARKMTEGITDCTGKRFFVNKLDVGKDNHQQIVLYCYKAGSLYTENYYLQQAQFALNQLLGKGKGGATIRVSMSITESEQVTLTRLKAFLLQAKAIVDSLK